METRNRFMLVLMALSLVVLLDFFTNGHAVLGSLSEAFVRSAQTSHDGWGISEDAPFVQRRGSESIDADGVTTLGLRGPVTFTLDRSDNEGIQLEYVVRTYGLSSRHVQEYHDQVAVRTSRRGDRVDIVLEAPAPTPEVEGVRGEFRLKVPDGLVIELAGEHGDINISGLRADLKIRQQLGSVRVIDLDGSVEAEVDQGSVWLAGVSKDVNLTHTVGRVEVLDVDGAFTLDADRAAVTAERIGAGIRANLERTAAALYNVAGSLDIDARMAKVVVAGGAGSVQIDGRYSPIEVRGETGPLAVESHRAHVRLELPSERAWAFDAIAIGGAIHTEGPLPPAAVSSGNEAQVRGTVGTGASPTPVRVAARSADVIIRLTP